MHKHAETAAGFPTARALYAHSQESNGGIKNNTNRLDLYHLNEPVVCKLKASLIRVNTYQDKVSLEYSVASLSCLQFHHISFGKHPCSYTRDCESAYHFRSSLSMRSMRPIQFLEPPGLLYRDERFVE